MGTAIDFTQPLEVIVMQLVSDMQRVKGDLYADGIQPGMVRKMDALLTSEEVRRQADAKRDADIEKRHGQNRFRLNVAIYLAGLSFSTILGILALLLRH